MGKNKFACDKNSKNEQTKSVHLKCKYPHDMKYESNDQERKKR